MGESGRRRRRDRRPSGALERLLEAMGEPPVAIPPEYAAVPRRQLAFVWGALGVAWAETALPEGFPGAETGYYLAWTPGGLVALWPRPLRGGYRFYDEGRRCEGRLGAGDGARFTGPVWRVFSPLPRRTATPWGAVARFLTRRCGGLPALLAALPPALTALSLLAGRTLRAGLLGAGTWVQTLLPLTALTVGGVLTACLWVGLCRRTAALAGDGAAAAVLWRQSAGPEEGDGSVPRLCQALGGVAAPAWGALALTALALAASPWTGLAGPALGTALWGVGLCAASSLLFWRAGRPPAGLLPAGLALGISVALWRCWAADLGLAGTLAGLTALAPVLGAWLLLAAVVPALALAVRRGGGPLRPLPAGLSPDARAPLTRCDGSLVLEGAAAEGLTPITLRIAPGEKLGVYGPPGGGKSRLLRLLSGALPPQRGTVYCGGRDCAFLQGDALRSWVRLEPRPDPHGLPGRGDAAILLCDRVERAGEAQEALAFPGTAVLASPRRELLKGCTRLFYISGGVLREERVTEDG